MVQTRVRAAVGTIAFFFIAPGGLVIAAFAQFVLEGHGTPAPATPAHAVARR